MTTIEIDPAADMAALVDVHRELGAAVLGDGEAETMIELGSGRPGHLVLQLLASAARTQPAAGRRVRFGPRAAAELARMDLPLPANEDPRA